jgi:hypothetical protein
MDPAMMKIQTLAGSHLLFSQNCRSLAWTTEPFAWPDPSAQILLLSA